MLLPQLAPKHRRCIAHYRNHRRCVPPFPEAMKMPLELLLRTAKELVAAWDNSGPDSVATRAALNRLGAAAYNSVDALGSLSAERDALAARVAQADAVAAEIRADSPASYMQEWADRLSPPTASPAPVSEPAINSSDAYSKSIEQPATEPAQVHPDQIGIWEIEPGARSFMPTVAGYSLPDGAYPLVSLSMLESVRADLDMVRRERDAYRAELQECAQQRQFAERGRDAYIAAAGEFASHTWASFDTWITNRVAELMGDTK